MSDLTPAPRKKTRRGKRKNPPKLWKSTEPQVKLIKDARNGSMDQHIPQTEAERLCRAGVLVKLDLGPKYPTAYIHRNDL